MNGSTAPAAGQARAAGAQRGITSDRPAVSAVMPARNEAERIALTIAELQRYVDEIVVVDDASDDDTAVVAAGAGAVVTRSDTHLGYVGALGLGFAAASGEIVVTVDADGEMPVERIGELVAPIVAGTADMVQGHRSHVPRLSERIVTAIAAIGGPVGDSGTGFRALRAELARGLVIPGSCICGSFTLAARARGARLAEIPVVTRPVPGRKRRIAWGHLAQAILVARLAIRVRLSRTGRLGER
jgi:cellulose synthase/poly-beta-1,6-N-acetylglucosamine synthase-like glycosyltransferase